MVFIWIVNRVLHLSVFFPSISVGNASSLELFFAFPFGFVFFLMFYKRLNVRVDLNPCMLRSKQKNDKTHLAYAAFLSLRSCLLCSIPPIGFPAFIWISNIPCICCSFKSIIKNTRFACYTCFDLFFVRLRLPELSMLAIISFCHLILF